MSNLSDIGFPVASEQDVNQIIMDILPHLQQLPCPPYGYYFRFEDPSGAQIFLQTNSAQEIVGFNPAFKAESRWHLKVKQVIDRDTSDLDGAFECFHPASGSTHSALVFDAPDFRIHQKIDEGTDVQVGITAFASNDFKSFENEDAFVLETGMETAKMMDATGLYEADKDGNRVPRLSPQAHVVMTGIVTESYKRQNSFTNENFLVLVVDTDNGFVDVVVDPRLAESGLEVGNVIHGSFWLSGQIA